MMRGVFSLPDKHQKSLLQFQAGTRCHGGLLRKAGPKITQEQIESIYQSGLDINDILLIAFLAKKQIHKIGQNWQEVASRIQMHPAFYCHPLNASLVSRIYTFISFYDQGEDEQTFRMPYAQYPLCQDQKQWKSTGSEMQAVEDASMGQEHFDFDRYQQMIGEKPQIIVNANEEYEEEVYERFTSNVMGQMKQRRITLPHKKSNGISWINGTLNRLKGSDDKIKLQKYQMNGDIEYKVSQSEQKVEYMKTPFSTYRNSKKIRKDCELPSLLMRLKKGHA